jgi:hypothetical protein
VKHPADIFPRHARHRGEVTLGDFLPHGDAAFAEVPAEKLWRLNGARDASPLIRRFQLRISGVPVSAGRMPLTDRSARWELCYRSRCEVAPSRLAYGQAGTREPFSCAFQQVLELDSIHAAAHSVFFGDAYHTPGISAVAWRFRGKRPSFPAPLGPSKPPADLEGQSLRDNACPPVKRFLVMVITSFRQRPR